jgi:hypothetical protein
MVADMLGLILALGIPFLLYCLWQFARELQPRKSTAGAPVISSRWSTVRATPARRVRSRASVAQLRNEGRVAS